MATAGRGGTRANQRSSRGEDTAMAAWGLEREATVSWLRVRSKVESVDFGNAVSSLMPQAPSTPVCPSPNCKPTFSSKVKATRDGYSLSAMTTPARPSFRTQTWHRYSKERQAHSWRWGTLDTFTPKLKRHTTSWACRTWSTAPHAHSTCGTTAGLAPHPLQDKCMPRGPGRKAWV